MITEVLSAPGVGFVRRPLKPGKTQVQSEGMEQIGASGFHAFGYDGRGSKVAIIDSGFDGLSMAQARGELPTILQSIDFTQLGMEVNGPHGTACAEIVHDVAPGADLYLIRIGDLVDLENAKDYVISQGVDVVNHSMAWLGSGFGDGLGVSCAIVNDASENGVLWVNAAGNYATRQVSSFFQDPESDGFHNFGQTNLIPLKRVNAGETLTLYLTWNDWPTTIQDYDLILYKQESDGWHVVESADDFQFFTPPVEWMAINIREQGQYAAAIWKSPGARSTVFKLWSELHDFESFQSIVGTIGSPADAQGAVAVGAISFDSWPQGPVEDFSSRGPTVDGRVKPDLVAPDRVSTLSYGSESFPGTSAAAPHVAGAAAVLQSSDPAYFTNPSRLKDALITATVDMGELGKDNVFGHGRLALTNERDEGPRAVVSNDQLFFGRISVGQTKDLGFSISNTGESALQLSLDSQISGFSVSGLPASVASGFQKTLSVAYSPHSAGSSSGSLNIVTNDPKAPIITISLFGSASNAPATPRLSVSPGGLHFGLVEVGQQVNRTITLSNVGSGDLVVGELRMSGANFTHTGTPMTIGPGESTTITVTARPASAEEFAAQLTIASNDPNIPLTHISLAITGLAQAAFSITLDVDPAPGDQEIDVRQVGSGGQVVVQVHGQEIGGIVGFRATLIYDPDNLKLVDFQPSDILPDVRFLGFLQPDPGMAELAVASLGSTATKTEGLLGSLVLSVTETFNQAVLAVDKATIRREGYFITQALVPTIEIELAQQLAGDFDGDGSVGFPDFIAFAGRFGARRDAENYDAAFDLDSDGEIGFTDFIQFADAFGS